MNCYECGRTVEELKLANINLINFNITIKGETIYFCSTCSQSIVTEHVRLGLVLLNEDTNTVFFVSKEKK